MDGIRKKNSPAPRAYVQIEPKPEFKLEPKPELKSESKSSHYLSPRKDELFISQEETLRDYQKQKAQRRKQKLLKSFWFFLLLLFFLVITCGLFFAWKTYAVSKKINTSSKQTNNTFMQDVKTFIKPGDENYTLKGQENGRINILLLGAAGENKPGGNLTDTIMVMSIDTKNRKVAMLSLPRDFYVEIPETKTFTKINSLYKIGLNQEKKSELITQAVEKITGLTIDYHLIVNFDAFEKIVDDIGGVNITSERDIYDPRYPGPNYSYETFQLAKGSHLLDGKTALKYVRMRHDDPEGDFGRAKRQQQVIQAVKNKLFSVQTLFNVVAINNILNTLGNNVQTNMSLEDLEQFIRLSKNVDTQNINNAVVDAWKPESLLKVSHVTVGNVQAFILVPRVGNYSEIQELAQNIFNQSEIKKRQQEIINENASILIVNNSEDIQLANKIKKLLSEKLGMKNVRVDWKNKDEIQEQTTISSDQISNKLFTIDELIKKLPAKLSEQKTDTDDNITITLGNDLIDIYKYEEDNIDDFKKAEDNNANVDFINTKN